MSTESNTKPPKPGLEAESPDDFLEKCLRVTQTFLGLAGLERERELLKETHVHFGPTGPACVAFADLQTRHIVLNPDAINRHLPLVVLHIAHEIGHLADPKLCAESLREHREAGCPDHIEWSKAAELTAENVVDAVIQAWEADLSVRSEDKSMRENTIQYIRGCFDLYRRNRDEPNGKEFTPVALKVTRDTVVDVRASIEAISFGDRSDEEVDAWVNALRAIREYQADPSQEYLITLIPLRPGDNERMNEVPDSEDKDATGSAVLLKN